MEPWEGGSALDEVGATAGTGAGGDELLGVEPASTPEAEPAAPAAAAASAAGEESPMMPMMPGAGTGAPGASSSADRTDASGLLEGGVEEWAAEPGADEVDSPTGAAAVAAGSLLDGGHDDDAAGSGSAAEEAAPWIVPDDPTAAEGGGVGDSGEDVADGGVEIVEQWPQASAAWSEQLREGDRYAAEQPDQYFDGGLSDGGEAGYGETDEPPHAAADDVPDDRVPVVGHSGSAEDTSNWEIAGASADIGLFALGLWATRRRRTGDEDGVEVEARIVSGDEGGWVGGGGAAPGDDGEEPDGMPDVATWRPNRSAEPAAAGAGAAEGRVNAMVGRRRLGRPPEGYDPEAAAAEAEIAAAAAAAEAENEEPTPDEELPAKSRGAASLLVQDPGMWGSARTDWDSL